VGGAIPIVLSLQRYLARQQQTRPADRKKVHACNTIYTIIGQAAARCCVTISHGCLWCDVRGVSLCLQYTHYIDGRAMQRMTSDPVCGSFLRAKAIIVYSLDGGSRNVLDLGRYWVDFQTNFSFAFSKDRAIKLYVRFSRAQLIYISIFIRRERLECRKSLTW
jgi:hypothetical protein